jgi:N-acetylneuraminic acid mutarotase
MPTPRAVFAIAVYQNKIYCIGGKTSDEYTGVNEVYDPATNTWETKTSMPTARSWLTANVVNGKIYLMGGYPDITLNEVYDPATDSWTTKTPAPNTLIFGFDKPASAVIDNKIYVIGGISQDQSYDLNQIYDAETDTWSQGVSPITSVDGGAAAATTGVLAPKRIYVLGNSANFRQGEEQNFVRVYDPENDNWTFGADIHIRRYNFGVAVVNDTLYAIGGHTYNFPGNYAPSAANEQYTPIGYIPEFPSWTPILILMAILTTTAVIFRKNLKTPTQTR